ncbi:hypothetical protein HDU98_008680 [Podochytrium sp. JEL0797]|nr:hypothetical protein HDU98_008680 [Podochytrium sp. JEL0797]
MCVDDCHLNVFDYNKNEARGTVGAFGRLRNTKFSSVKADPMSVYEKRRILRDVWGLYWKFLGNSIAEKLGVGSDLTIIEGKQELLRKVVAEGIKMIDEQQNAVEIVNTVVRKGAGKKETLMRVVQSSKPASKRSYLLQFLHHVTHSVVFSECIDTGDGDGTVETRLLLLPVLKDGKDQASRYLNASLQEQVQLKSVLTQEMAFHSKVARFVNPSGRARGYIAVDQRQEHSNRDLKECKGIKKTDDFETALARSLAGHVVFKSRETLSVGVGIKSKNGFHPPPKFAPELASFYKDLETIGMLSDVPDPRYKSVLISELNMDLKKEAARVIQTVRDRTLGKFVDEETNEEEDREENLEDH